jgi:hypothetical protein
VGFLIGLVYQLLLWRIKLKELPTARILIISSLFLMFLIIDSMGSFLQLWSSPNLTRLILGLLGGSSISLYLFPVFNFSLFRNCKENTGIKIMTEYFGLLFLLGLGSLLILSQNHFFYYILAFSSIAGIILLYLTINITIAARIADWLYKKKNRQSISFLIIITLILTIFEIYLFRKKPLHL